MVHLPYSVVRWLEIKFMTNYDTSPHLWYILFSSDVAFNQIYVQLWNLWYIPFFNGDMFSNQFSDMTSNKKKSIVYSIQF